MRKLMFFLLLTFGIGPICSANDIQLALFTDVHLNPWLKSSMPFQPKVKGTDLDLKTFEILFSELKARQQKEQWDGVITLGDMVGHGVSIAQRKKIEQHIFQKFSEFSVPVFVGFGNNDSLFGNYQRFANQHDSSYQLALKTWPGATSGFIHNASMTKCKQHSSNLSCLIDEKALEGHYSVQLKSHLRLISFNSVVLNGDYLSNDQRKASFAIDWLKTQLLDSASQGDSVLLTMHVPPGKDLNSNYYHFREKLHHRPVFQSSFVKLIQFMTDIKHLNLIAILAGHTHHDETHLIHTKLTNIPVFVVPALSSMHGNSPAYKVISLKKEKNKWVIQSLKAYASASPKHGFKQYGDLTSELCQKLPVSICWPILYKNPKRLLEYVRAHYFANNAKQKDKGLEISPDALITSVHRTSRSLNLSHCLFPAA